MFTEIRVLSILSKSPSFVTHDIHKLGTAKMQNARRINHLQKKEERREIRVMIVMFAEET